MFAGLQLQDAAPDTPPREPSSFSFLQSTTPSEEGVSSSLEAESNSSAFSFLDSAACNPTLKPMEPSTRPQPEVAAGSMFAFLNAGGGGALGQAASPDPLSSTPHSFPLGCGTACAAAGVVSKPATTAGLPAPPHADIFSDLSLLAPGGMGSSAVHGGGVVALPASLPPPANGAGLASKKVVKKTSKARKPGWASKEPEPHEPISRSGSQASLDSLTTPSASGKTGGTGELPADLGRKASFNSLEAVEMAATHSPARRGADVAHAPLHTAALASAASLEKVMGAVPATRRMAAACGEGASPSRHCAPMLSDSDVAAASAAVAPARPAAADGMRRDAKPEMAAAVISSPGILGGLVARAPSDLSATRAAAAAMSSEGATPSRALPLEQPPVLAGSGFGLLSGLTLRTHRPAPAVEQAHDPPPAEVDAPLATPAATARATPATARCEAPAAERGAPGTVTSDSLPAGEGGGATAAAEGGAFTPAEAPTPAAKSPSRNAPSASSRPEAAFRSTSPSERHSPLTEAECRLPLKAGRSEDEGADGHESAGAAMPPSSAPPEEAVGQGEGTSAAEAAPERSQGDGEQAPGDSGMAGEEDSARHGAGTTSAEAPPAAPPPAAPPTAEETAKHELTRRKGQLASLREETRALLTRRSDAAAAVQALEAELRQAEIAQQEASNAEDFEAAEALEEQLDARRAELARGEAEVREVDDALLAAEAALLESCEMEVAARNELLARMEQRRAEEWAELQALRLQSREHASSENERIAVELERLSVDSQRLREDLDTLDRQEHNVHAKIEAEASDEIEARKAWEVRQQEAQAEMEELRRRVRAPLEAHVRHMDTCITSVRPAAEVHALLALLQLAILEERDAECASAICGCDAKIAAVRRGYEKQLSRLQLQRESLGDRLRGVEGGQQDLKVQAEELKKARRMSREGRERRRADLLQLRESYVEAKEQREQRQMEARQLRCISAERLKWRELQLLAKQRVDPLRKDLTELHEAVQQLSAVGLAHQAERKVVRQEIIAAASQQPELLEQKQLAVASRSFKDAGRLTSELKALAAKEEEARLREVELSSFIEENKVQVHILADVRDEAESELSKLQREADETLYNEALALLRTANSRGNDRTASGSNDCELQLIEAHRGAMIEQALSLKLKLGLDEDLEEVLAARPTQAAEEDAEGEGAALAKVSAPILGEGWDFDDEPDSSDEADSEEASGKAADGEANADGSGDAEISAATVCDDEHLPSSTEMVETEEPRVGSSQENEAGGNQVGCVTVEKDPDELEAKENVEDDQPKRGTSSSESDPSGDVESMERAQSVSPDPLGATPHEDGVKALEPAAESLETDPKAQPETAAASDDGNITSEQLDEDCRSDTEEKGCGNQDLQQRISLLSSRCEELNAAIDTACIDENFDEADSLQKELQRIEEELNELSHGREGK